jgi:hypothetical protein
MPLSARTWISWGGVGATLSSIPAASAAKVPRGVDDVGAAWVAMVGLAALQAFRDVARVAPKERVLVNGATGGIGLMLLQLARLRGAHVTAVASTKGVPVARQFGADEVVDYHSVSIADLRERFDVVFDTSSVVKHLSLVAKRSPAVSPSSRSGSTSTKWSCHRWRDSTSPMRLEPSSGWSAGRHRKGRDPNSRRMLHAKIPPGGLETAGGSVDVHRRPSHQERPREPWLERGAAHGEHNQARRRRRRRSQSHCSAREAA